MRSSESLTALDFWGSVAWDHASRAVMPHAGPHELEGIAERRRSWREPSLFDMLSEFLYATTMDAATNLSLETLSIGEKLILMERLWTDLSRCPGDVQSPDWHGDVLAARVQAVQEGKTQFVNWDAYREC